MPGFDPGSITRDYVTLGMCFTLRAQLPCSPSIHLSFCLCPWLFHSAHSSASTICNGNNIYVIQTQDEQTNMWCYLEDAQHDSKCQLVVCVTFGKQHLWINLFLNPRTQHDDWHTTTIELGSILSDKQQNTPAGFNSKNKKIACFCD